MPANNVNSAFAIADKTDGRAVSSQENGAKGGRDPIDVLEIAEHYAGTKTVDGIITLRNWRGNWYSYQAGAYTELPEGDFEADLTAFIQYHYSNTIPRISQSILNDVALNLRSSLLCNIPATANCPSWLSGTEPAEGWLTMRNCLFNIITGEQRAHTPKLFSLYRLDYDYLPDATCPRWMQYLKEVQPETPENIGQIQKMFGLSTLPDTKFNIFFILFGEGGTGKSVSLYILTKTVGEVNCCCIPLLRLAEKFSLYPLTTKLLNVVGESPYQTKFNELAGAENRLKEITDGGLIDIERKMKEPYSARVTARCVFATNNLPLFSDRSNGVWDRLRIIPFDTVIRGSERENNALRQELEAELPGVFNWALEGLKSLSGLRQFPDVPKSKELKEEHRGICDHERVFLHEFYAFGIGAKNETREVFEHYRNWMKNNGYNSMGEARFSQSVKRVFPKVFKEKLKVDAKHYWTNLSKIL